MFKSLFNNINIPTIKELEDTSKYTKKKSEEDFDLNTNYYGVSFGNVHYYGKYLKLSDPLPSRFPNDNDFVNADFEKEKNVDYSNIKFYSKIMPTKKGGKKSKKSKKSRKQSKQRRTSKNVKY
jgi:hypothetical protein